MNYFLWCISAAERLILCLRDRDLQLYALAARRRIRLLIQLRLMCVCVYVFAWLVHRGKLVNRRLLRIFAKLFPFLSIKLVVYIFCQQISFLYELYVQFDGMNNFRILYNSEPLYSCVVYLAVYMYQDPNRKL